MTVSICVNGLSAPFAKSVACETNKCTPMDDFSVQGVLTHHPLKYLRIIFLVNFSSVILRKLLSVLGVSNLLTHVACSIRMSPDPLNGYGARAGDLPITPLETTRHNCISFITTTPSVYLDRPGISTTPATSYAG